MTWVNKTSSEKGEKNINALEGKFNELLIAAIDDELSLLGELVKNSFYVHLENTSGIGKDDIPQQVEEFSKVLHRFFGLDASRLEIRFLRSLYLKLKVEFEFPEIDLCEWIESEFSFAGCINYMKRNFESCVGLMK